MKKTVLLVTIILAAILSASSQSMAQQVSYDSLCASYKTYYSLEEALKDPLKVQKLDLSMQKLTVIPEDLMKLENLVCLDLAFNRISTLPASFATLTKLENLNLMGTRYMAKLPAVVGKLPSLKVLELGDHPEWSAATYAEAAKIVPNVSILK